MGRQVNERRGFITASALRRGMTFTWSCDRALAENNGETELKLTVQDKFFIVSGIQAGRQVEYSFTRLKDVQRFLYAL